MKKMKKVKAMTTKNNKKGGSVKRKFAYRIAGRSEGSTQQENYSGKVVAATTSDAMLAAMAAEFGDPGHACPLDALEEWAGGRECLVDTFITFLEDGARSAELDLGDLNFVVEVDPI